MRPLIWVGAAVVCLPFVAGAVLFPVALGLDDGWLGVLVAALYVAGLLLGVVPLLIERFRRHSAHRVVRATSGEDVPSSLTYAEAGKDIPWPEVSKESGLDTEPVVSRVRKGETSEVGGMVIHWDYDLEDGEVSEHG